MTLGAAVEAQSHNPRLTRVLAAIDEANAADPHLIEAGEGAGPAELIYGRRMSERLAHFAPDASEHLQIAVRAQHIERWTRPRHTYPEGRVGYLTWRRDLKDFHAARVSELMRSAGYDDADIARVAALVRKERFKTDPDAQTLEDVACLVFLEHYFDAFSPKVAEEKLADILAKTWDKMSSAGHSAAAALNLPKRAHELLRAGQARRAVDRQRP